MRTALHLTLCAVTAVACSGQASPGPAVPVAEIAPLRATDALPRDPDDPAIWVNRADPSNSLILGTMKVAAPDGALAVFGMDGKLRQLLNGSDRPNNVDVEYGLDLDATPTDIAVLTERLGRRLRVYAIAPDGTALRDVSAGTMSILEGAPGDLPKETYLWQYRLHDDGAGGVKATFARRFGVFSGVGEIETVAVDDELGYVYYADEDVGIHKYPADPDAPDANRELALFGTTGYQHDREGIGIYALASGKGYIVSVDQVSGESVFHVYRREGEPDRPHDHSKVLLSFKGGADATDGLDVTSAPLGPDFPAGALVAMNSANSNFLILRWKDIAAAAKPPLRSTAAPRSSALH